MDMGDASISQRVDDLLGVCVDSKRSGDLCYGARRFDEAAGTFSAAAQRLEEVMGRVCGPDQRRPGGNPGANGWLL